MTNYQEARHKLTIAQLNNLKSTAKNNTGATLRITKTNFRDEELPLMNCFKQQDKQIK